MNRHQKTLRLVMAGVFAALTCIGTMLIRIPTIKGYIHIGDCMVVASGILLGPVAGGFAAGIGSMLADLLGGYVAFSFATFAIKFLAAVVSGLAFRAFHKIFKHNDMITTALCAAACELIVIAGYFLFEIFYEGWAAAIAEILPNAIQGVTALALSSALVPVLFKIPQLKSATRKN